MKKLIVLLTVAILLTGCKKGNEKSSDTTEERGSTEQITENGEMDETTTENKEIKYDTYTDSCIIKEMLNKYREALEKEYENQ